MQLEMRYSSCHHLHRCLTQDMPVLQEEFTSSPRIGCQAGLHPSLRGAM